MSWLDQLAEKVEELRRAGNLQQIGRSAEALPILDEVLISATDHGLDEVAIGELAARIGRQNLKPG